ncbi:regulator [Citrobacter braakii]|nr:regulator [Citrobacter braakii]
MDKLQKIDAAVALLRDMKKDLNRLAKLSSVDYRDLTSKQCQKVSTEANWIGMENFKRKHELHALAVELGFAERREHYDPIELTDGWHRFKYQPREPE